MRKRPANEIPLSPHPSPPEGVSERERQDEGDTGRNQRKQGSPDRVEYKTHQPHARKGDRADRGVHADGQIERGDEHRHHGADEDGDDLHPDIDLRRLPPVQELGQRVGVDDDSRRVRAHPRALTQLRSPVAVDVRQIGTDENDLSREPRLRKQLQRVGGEGAEG